MVRGGHQQCGELGIMVRLRGRRWSAMSSLVPRLRRHRLDDDADDVFGAPTVARLRVVMMLMMMLMMMPRPPARLAATSAARA
eukprot:4016542-Pleurochrysis_carterae.AAC.2